MKTVKSVSKKHKNNSIRWNCQKWETQSEKLVKTQNHWNHGK